MFYDTVGVGVQVQLCAMWCGRRDSVSLNLPPPESSTPASSSNSTEQSHTFPSRPVATYLLATASRTEQISASQWRLECVVRWYTKLTIYIESVDSLAFASFNLSINCGQLGECGLTLQLTGKVTWLLHLRSAIENITAIFPCRDLLGIINYYYYSKLGAKAWRWVWYLAT